jgi:hypothetical protein
MGRYIGAAITVAAMVVTAELAINREKSLLVRLRELG